MNYFKKYEMNRNLFYIGAKFVEKYERYPHIIEITHIITEGVVTLQYLNGYMKDCYITRPKSYVEFFFNPYRGEIIDE